MRGKRVFVIGNGGSYANSLHICNDLLSRGVKCFTMDPATLTAFSNDYGYGVAFEKWISVVGEKGDVLICLSGSGKSENILRGIEAAKKKEMEVVKVFGSEMNQDMQEAEEFQIQWGHELWRTLKT